MATALRRQDVRKLLGDGMPRSSAEIAEALDWNRSTTWRVLDRMHDVERIGRGQYRLKEKG